MAKYSYDFIEQQAMKMSKDLAVVNKINEEDHWSLYGEEIIECLEKILNGEKNG